MSRLIFFEGSVSQDGPDLELAAKLWGEGLPMAEVALRVGCTSRHLDHLRATGKIVLPTRGLGGTGISKEPPRPPAPSEIRQRAAEVRGRWSPEEELQRRAGSGCVLTDQVAGKLPARYGRQASERGVEFGVE